MTPLYSVGTYDFEIAAYTPQFSDERAFNLTLHDLRRELHALREVGYSAHRFRQEDGLRNSDSDVLVERTDGLPAAEILEGWKR